ncbi:MAG: glycoside hydrolase family 2 protein [Oligosphaeraceae bacterium]
MAIIPNLTDENSGYRTNRPWRPKMDLCDCPWQVHHFLEGTVPVRTPFDLLTYAVPGVPARVPGNVELDLMASGELPDPFVGLNSLSLRPYEFHQYWYETRFLTPAFDDPELVFEGLDCYADIWLNGKLVGTADNALIEHRFEIRESLAVIGQENRLFVCLKSPVNQARQAHGEVWSHGGDRVLVRKPAHCYGWDIMPRILSAGIWRPVYIEARLEHEVEELHLQTVSCGEAAASVEVWAHIKTSERTLEGMALRVSGRCGDSEFSVTRPLWDFNPNFRFRVERPQLWWPRGYGEASLYEVTVELLKDGATLCRRRETLGIRTVQVERRIRGADGSPAQFQIVVNGVPVMAKGSNWVPADALHSRDAARIPRILELFRDMGCNIVRCWGGNVYEPHTFFDLCDQYGIMVWQDFGMACASYPQDEAFLARFRTEAESVVREYRRHPSIILWAGDNENDEGYRNWFGQRVDPARNRLTREVLPQVLDRLDPSRPYLPSSPYFSPDMLAAGQELNEGPEQHLWGPRGYYKAPFYAQNRACFASEIGYHGCPAVRSIRQFISPERVWPCTDNPEWELHSTDATLERAPQNSRVLLMRRQVEALFGNVPETLEDFALASQAVQAEALKFFVELFRGGRPQRTGIIWWNMMDGWPQMSDAIVDYYFTPKLAYPILRRIHQEVCVIIGEPNESGQSAVILCNDSRETHTVAFRVRRGLEQRLVLEKTVELPPNQNAVAGFIDANPAEQDLFIMTWTADGTVSGANHYLLGQPPFDLARYREWLRLIIDAQPFDWDYQ